MRRLIPILILTATLLSAQVPPGGSGGTGRGGGGRGGAPNPYPLTADSQAQPNVPHGTVTPGILPPGKYYPGTPHNYSLYVPAQYDASKPTPFMVFLDGGNGSYASVFDNLIAKKEIPPMIAISIRPGVLPVIAPNAQNRVERIFEYDSINGRYADFLENEMIPEIAKKYNLSKDPNDHGISGVSTGAVCAFAAAWNRPDLFRRVYTIIGTFVAMKGADSLFSMVRKSEPKPIRIFMQDGKNDHITANQPFGSFFAGSWPINNQVMFEDLQYSGYDVRLEIGTGGHDGNQGNFLMPEVMRWLWRDYPKPVTAQLPSAFGKPDWDPRGQVFSSIAIDKPWEQIGATYKEVVTPASDKDGNTYFAEPAANRIHKADVNGKVTVFKENSLGARALRVGADGRLYAAQPSRKRIVSWGPDGSEKVVAQNVTANDLAITIKNDIYFVDTAAKTVGHVDPAGKVSLAWNAAEMLLPTSITLSPDQAMVVVADAQNKFSWSLQIAADGTLINGEPFFRVDMPDVSPWSGVSSVAVDSIGQVYFASALGLQLCEQNGRAAAILSKPELGTVTGMSFGGKDLGYIYAAVNGKLFRRPFLRPGVAAWAIVKPPNPPT